jgi:D-lactate dehydrogenase
MKAIVYSTRRNEREFLIRANDGKHELTLEVGPLNVQTAVLAADHQAVIVFTNDEVSCSVISKLAELGVMYIMTRSAGTDHIDFNAASQFHIDVKNVPDYSPYAVSEFALAITLALSRHVVEGSRNAKVYDFSLDHLAGFNLYDKTVGIIGLGHIGKATAKLFNGFGCKVLGYDINTVKVEPSINFVEMNELLKSSDIISLHVPLNDVTFHIINSKVLEQMKPGAMLINTARGALVNTKDVLSALDSGQLAYYGADVYEFERGLFFEDHEGDHLRDALLSRLMEHRNVLLTPHQAFLTVEALSGIASQLIQGLNEWELKPKQVLV